MRFLITGGAGFIGYNYAKHRLERGDEVTVIDNLSRKGSRSRADILASGVYGKVMILPYDLNDARIAPTSNYDAVIHLAAQTAVTRSFDDPWGDFRANMLGTLKLLEISRQEGPPFPKFIYASTNKVYGTLDNNPFYGDHYAGFLAAYTGSPQWPFPIDEDFPVDLRTPYGISKGAADYYCQEYGRHFGIPTIILRQSCIYGPYQTAEADQGWVMHFADSILHEKPITIFGDGNQVRDILHINDLMDLYDRLLQDSHTPGVVYNVGGGPENAIRVKDVAETLPTITGKTSIINYGPRRPDDQDYYVSDITKIGKATGWKPEVSATIGLKVLVKWLKENPEWLSTKTI